MSRHYEEIKVTRDTPNRGAADCGLVARLPEDALKVRRYFPTLIFSLEVPDSEILNAPLIEEIYAERERDRTGVRKSNFRSWGVGTATSSCTRTSRLRNWFNASTRPRP